MLKSLASIFQAMLVSEEIVQDAASNHLDRVIVKLAERGIDASTMAMPYLEVEKANLQLGFVQRLETLFTRMESYLLTSTKAISLYTADGEKMTALDRGMAWKAITSQRSLVVQWQERIISETQQLNTRIQQRLEEQGQRALGLEYYIWRSRDVDKVRGAHAENDDRIFRWDTPPEGGHPRSEYNCRCYAEPYISENLKSEELLLHNIIRVQKPISYVAVCYTCFYALKP